MSLASNQSRIGLELSTIPERREYTVRRVELAVRNQQIRVASVAFVGLVVDEQGERRALDDENIDAAGRERVQQNGERFLAKQVSRDPSVARCGLHPSRASRQGPEQDAPGRPVVEQRFDQVPMFVESRGLTYERHDAVGARQLE